MTLLFHFTNAEHCVGLIDEDEGTEWFACGPSDERHALLEKATIRAARRKRPPRRVVVTLFDSVEGQPYPASFSAVRAAVAAANTLAFAWGVPVARAVVAPTATREQVAAMVLDGLFEEAAQGEWLRPEYSGEPNITTPKG